MRLVPPPLHSWYTSFFVLVGPGSLHEFAVSAFSRFPLGRATTFVPYIFLPARISRRSSPFTLFLGASLSLVLSFLSLLSCTPQTYLWTAYLLGFLLCPSILSRLRCPSLFQLAVLLLSPIHLYQLWLAFSFLHVPYFMLPFQHSHVSF